MSTESTGFLYPFIEADERDASTLVDDLASSARAKMTVSRTLRALTLEQCGEEVRKAAVAMSERFCRGGRLFSFGNGGSATDAAGTVELFSDPPSGRALAAMSLAHDRAVLTALANDIGTEVIYSRQIIAHARADDIAVGFSTSGDSANVLRAFEEASRRQVLTVGFAGYDGGAMASSDVVDHCFVVRSDSVHRIQEAQDALMLELWSNSSALKATLRTIVTDTMREEDDRGREEVVFDRIEAFRRRKPRLLDEVVTLAHGAGGKASLALIANVFLPAFDNGEVRESTDAAVVELPSGERLAFSTDSFVVKPLRFPGGSVGHLAVHGTINDLAMMGARPLALSAAFVLEEGFPIGALREVVADMAGAAASAGVSIVTGDTKVVDHGAADGMYISTAGIGVVPAGRSLSSSKVHDGDVVLVSGTIGDHGMAVMLARGDLALEAEIVSDTAPLHELMEDLLTAAPSTRWLRDATRGGVGTVCNELAHESNLTVVLEEAALPIRPQVAAACELLGIDPLYAANEGKFVAVVAPEEATEALTALRSHPCGREAARIGEICSEPPGIVVLVTPLGGTRIVDMLVGDPLPRIC